MAYYLLRDQPGVKYLNFDLPESIALATYYLMKALPHKKFLLFGETPLTGEAIADADVVLLPLGAMKVLSTGTVDVTFSSHAMTDLEAAELTSYLETIQRVTRSRFLFVGTASLPNTPGLLGGDGSLFRLEEQRQLRWNSHRRPPAEETEELYSFNPSQPKQPGAEGSLAHADR